MSAPSLEALGWSAHFEEAFAPYAGDGFVPARVAVQHRGAYVVCAETGELTAELEPGGSTTSRLPAGCP